MRYVLTVNKGAYGAQSAFLAWQFAERLIARGHQITQVFFFQDGALTGIDGVNPASDEVNLTARWQQTASQHQIALHLCIAGAARRGIHERNLAAGFRLAGLGEFSAAMLNADRLINF